MGSKFPALLAALALGCTSSPEGIPLLSKNLPSLTQERRDELEQTITEHIGEGACVDQGTSPCEHRVGFQGPVQDVFTYVISYEKERAQRNGSYFDVPDASVIYVSEGEMKALCGETDWAGACKKPGSDLIIMPDNMDIPHNMAILLHELGHGIYRGMHEYGAELHEYGGQLLLHDLFPKISAMSVQEFPATISEGLAHWDTPQGQIHEDGIIGAPAFLLGTGADIDAAYKRMGSVETAIVTITLEEQKDAAARDGLSHLQRPTVHDYLHHFNDLLFRDSALADSLSGEDTTEFLHYLRINNHMRSLVTIEDSQMLEQLRADMLSYVSNEEFDDPFLRADVVSKYGPLHLGNAITAVQDNGLLDEQAYTYYIETIHMHDHIPCDSASGYYECPTLARGPLKALIYSLEGARECALSLAHATGELSRLEEICVELLPEAIGRIYHIDLFKDSASPATTSQSWQIAANNLMPSLSHVCARYGTTIDDREMTEAYIQFGSSIPCTQESWTSDAQSCERSKTTLRNREYTPFLPPVAK